MKPNSVSSTLVLSATVLALGLGLFIGRQTAARTSTDLAKPVSNAASAPTAKVQDGPKRYRIPVSDSQPSFGPKDALVTIVEWSEVPDPEAAAIEPALQAVLAHNKDTVRLVFRHYAHPERDSSALTHQFLRGAFEQGGKFWEARALLLQHQGDVSQTDLEGYSVKLGLDWNAISKAIEQKTYAGPLTTDRLFADMFGIDAPPAVFVNGRRVEPADRATLEHLVEEELRHGVEMVARGTAKADVYAELTKKGAWNRPTRQAR